MLEPIPIALLLALVAGTTARKVAEDRIRLGALAGVWLVYAVYEFLMDKRVLCTGECNRRVDLLLLYPLLLAGTGWLFAVNAFRAWRRRRHGGEP